MQVETSPKLNNEIIAIVISGIAFAQYQQQPDRLYQYLLRKLWGSGSTLAEITELSAAILNGDLLLVETDVLGERIGYLKGKRFETPTQHVIFVGHMGQPK